MATGTAASRSKGRGAAARSGVNGKGKSIKFRGLTLLLPADPPGDLAFSLQDGEISVALREVFGVEQYTAIREKLKDAGLTLDQTIKESDQLVSDCFAVWNTTPGE